MALLANAFFIVDSRAQQPQTGGRNIQDFAYADFAKQSGCLDMNSSVVFIAGDNLQDPIGSGKPSAWQDVQVFLTMRNSCSQTELVLYGLNTADVIPTFVRLESAVVSNLYVTLCDVPTCDGSVVAQSLVNLEWAGNGDSTVRIIRDPGARYHRQERFETASLTGSLSIGALPGWTIGLTFFPVDLTGAVIGTANEIDLP